MKTILQFFYEWEAARPDAPFLRQPVGDDWKTISWREAGQEARKIAAGLQRLGLQPGDHVGMVSKNCYHWIVADLAIMMGRFVSVPFYPNLTARQLAEVIELGDVKALFVGKLDDWHTMREGVPEGLPIIRFPHYAGNSPVADGIAWEEWTVRPETLEGNPGPELNELWTILFTSGTTGTPKGVMLSYASPARLMEMEYTHHRLKIFAGDTHRFFSYLPLNHIAERIIVECAALWTGGTISFAESLDAFAKNLQQTQPTLFMAVPRIWTKFQMGILARIPEKRLNLLLRLPLLSGFLKKKLAVSLGLSKARILLTGAAPAPNALKDFFDRLGLPIQEVYAMTENCGGCTLMPAQGIRPGTVGTALPGVEIRIDPDTGEVLAKAPWNMLGYYHSPEKTAEVLRDGWLHTGDQGELDPDGHLRLTGRVSDTFKSAKGKFIAPAPIEWGFAESACIEQICVAGLAIPQPLALVVLSESGQKTPREILLGELRSTLEQVNARLPKYEWVKSVVILKEPWTVENGILTPTLKIRRNVLNQRFQEKLQAWYELNQDVIWETEF